MASTFNLLTAGGARFDKSRFKRDFELFNPASSSKSGKKSRKGKEKEVPGGASGVLPANLDFFGDHSHATKAKPATEEDEDEDTVGEEDDELEENEERVEPPKQKITLSGVEPLPSSLHPNLPSLTTHENTALSSSAGKPLLKALSGANIHSLWGVQCAVGGSVLSGRDTMCIAPTGSGKTLSYLLPTIVRLQDPSKVIRRRATGADDSDEEAEQRDVDGEKDDARGIRSIVLVPTYDLAIQIRAVLKAVTRGRAWRAMVLTKATERAICASAPGSKYNSWASTSEGAAGGDSEEDEEDEDESGDEDASDAESTGSVNEFAQDSAQAEGDTESEADDDVEDSAALGLDFLIATPERLHHLLERKLVSLSRTRHIILDESDRLLSKDFRPQVEPILAAVSSTVQKTFLSATMPAGSEEIAKKWLRDGGVRVVVGVKDSAVSTVAQSLLYTGSESGKSLALRNMITSGELPYPSLIFVQSIARAEDLYKTLVLDGVRAEVVHGSKAKSKRDEAIAKFRRGEVWMLVVTEVLARGMDFRGVKVVVNYDFPQTTQSYIHRIGRTGRAGRPGRAITFFSNEDAPHLRTIANVLQASGCFVPPYMLDMPKPSKNLKKERAKAPVKRKDIGGAGRDVALEQSKKKRDMIKASQKRKGRE